MQRSLEINMIAQDLPQETSLLYFLLSCGGLHENCPHGKIGFNNRYTADGILWEEVEGVIVGRPDVSYVSYHFQHILCLLLEVLT